MGGVIDWQALPTLFELYGIDDPEIMIEQLYALRTHLERQTRRG